MHARRRTSALIVGALTVLATALTAPAAHAGGYGCSGSSSWSGPVYDAWGRQAGTIYDYFDGSRNCSVFVKGAYENQATYTSIRIENQKGGYDPASGDSGMYRTFAGPATIDGVGTCIREMVWMRTPDSTKFVDNYYTPWHSCG
ncbi:hypothetical protein OHA46_00185 [Streptomyces sp. NBC_00708]